MTVGEKLEALDFKYVVQILEPLQDKWHDYAMFKELGAANDFIKYQQMKCIMTDDYTLNNMFRIAEKE